MKKRWLFTLGSVAVLILFAPIFALTGCPQAPVPPPPPDPGMVDSGGDLDVAAIHYTCNSYCVHAQALKCPFSAPTHHDAGCVEVCTNIQSSGAVVWNLSCRTRATTCAAIDACEK